MLDNLKIHTHASFVELQAKHDDLSAKQKAHEKEVTDLKAAHEKEINDLKGALETAYSTAKDSLETQKAGFEKQISDLTTKVEIEKTSSEAKAISTLAKIGVPADETPKVETQTIDLVQQFEALKGAKRTAFYEQNQDAIHKAFNEKRRSVNSNSN